MRTTQLGKTGPVCTAVGIGTSALAGSYGAVEREQAVGVLRAALDAGVTLIDGGDHYGMGRAELMINEALRGRRREDAVLSIKYGRLVDPTGKGYGHDVSPVATKVALNYSLVRLNTDYIDIYRPSRITPDVPVEETVGAIGEMVDAGYVRHISLSEVGPETLRRACAERPIADVQLEYSVLYRVDDEMIATCRELGVAITAYGVLSRGLLSGRWTADREIAADDARGHAPRFESENLTQNLALVEALRVVADRHNATVGQLAIAWVASRGDDVVPLLGARTVEQLADGVGSLDVELTDEDLAEIEQSVPAGSVAGSRYPASYTGSVTSV